MIIDFVDSDFDSKIKNEEVSILQFSASWCAPCKVLKPIMEKLSDEFKDKANFSWTSTTAGQTIISIQNTGDSEFTESYKFELARDPLFFTYSILVIIAGVVVIGFSAGFSAKKPKGF